MYDPVVNSTEDERSDDGVHIITWLNFNALALNFASFGMIWIYVSVISKPDHPLRAIFLKGRIPHPRGTKRVRNLDPWDRKIVLKPHPRGNYFQKSSQKKTETKHEIEIMKNSTEMLICLEILQK